MIEENVNIYVNQIEKDLNNYIFDDYNYEINITCWQKILVAVLNVITGGLGTILLPFINKNRNYSILIFAGILLGFLQIFHFLHFFSLLKGVEFVEKIYDSISSDEIMGTFFGKEDIEENDESLIGYAIENKKYIIPEIIPQIERKKFLKISFGIISGMSYSNSVFTILVNFMAEKPEKSNLKLSIKIMLYSFFNPGAGIILSFLSLFPSCKKKDKIKPIILSITGIIIGIIFLFSPIFLIIGLFLTKITKKMITLLPLKITLIFFGIFGIFFSFITSGINKNTLLGAAKFKINPFDIIYKNGNQLKIFYSKIGLFSFIRFILNMLVSGIGTFTLLFRYGCDWGIIKVSLIQFFFGFISLITSILSIFKNNCQNWPFCGIFFGTIRYDLTYTEEDYYSSIITFLNFIFTISLSFYFSGLILIIICDYIEDKKKPPTEISLLAFLILNIFTGGLGISLFSLKIFKCCEYCFEDFKCEFTIILAIILKIVIELGSYICFIGTIFCIFFFNIMPKSYKIAFPVCYGFEILIFTLIYLCFRNPRNVASPNKRKFNKNILN